MKNNLFTISAHLPFADTLAEWTLAQWGQEPLTLSRALFLLPSRRAVLSLREAFLRAGGGRPMLLPRMEALGDAVEDGLPVAPFAGTASHAAAPPPQFAFQRLFVLARLVERWRAARGEDLQSADHALRLAGSLGDLLDEFEREEVSLERLQNIVPDAFAEHWQTTVEFLKILSLHWPQIALERGLTSPGVWHAHMLAALTEHWRHSPPKGPVIAAGTTGSIPSTSRLLAAVRLLPEGYIVLPGLDTEADEPYWDRLQEDHPQWGMRQLLRTLLAERADVSLIGPGMNARARLMSEVMRPAPVSDAWRDIAWDKAEALAGMTMLHCANVQEEATAIALHLRGTLEQPGKTAALVTHNRGLARRVASILQRFDVTIDDSAGLPLKETPLAAFLRLMLEAAFESLAPLALLALLKHPFAHVGMERALCLETARTLELLTLRGIRQASGIDGIRRALLAHEGTPASVHTLLDGLEQAFAPLLALQGRGKAALGTLLDTHMACADTLGAEVMWNGYEAEALSDCLWEVREALQAEETMIEPHHYPGLFDELLAGRVVRPQYGMHPRLKILSPMEARMQSFDRMVLGGLNENSWPPKRAGDPWFSRPMRGALRLPSPERGLGLAAHDFFMLAASSEVLLTRAEKEDGVPTQPSRYWVKLEMLAGSVPGAPELLAWARRLNLPEKAQAMAPPAPTPPLFARPRKISVTQVETWLRDPYAVYAAKILKLKALEPLGRLPDGSDFGNAVHRALERFVRTYPGTLPHHALPVLLRVGRESFAELFEASWLEILWWPRFARIAEWIIAQEETRRPLAQVAAEVKSACMIDGFELHGRADRTECGSQGRLTIIDYKTGGLPPVKDIESGLSSQLVLLALIARESAPDSALFPVTLEYWRLSGGVVPGQIKALDADKAEGYIAAARAGMRELIARYRDPAFPYRSVPVPARAGRYSDYVHLARIKEWG